MRGVGRRERGSCYASREMTTSGSVPETPPKTSPVTRWKRVLRPVLVTLALGFIVLAVVDLGRRWEESSVRLEPMWVAGALVPALLAPWLQGQGWIRLVEHLSGRSVPRQAALELYLDSQLARYTPGKLGLPAVRMAGADRLGVSSRVVGASILVELSSWLAWGGVMGATLVLLGAPASDGLLSLVAPFAGVLLTMATLGVLLLTTLDRQRFPARVRTLLFVDGPPPGQTGALVPWSLPLSHVAHWLAWGAHGALLAFGLGATFPAAVTVGGVTCLAIVLGFLAFLAPAGAGVREAVIGVGTAPLLGAPAAVTVGILARAASLTADVSVWLLVRGWGRAYGRAPKGAP